MNNETQEAVNDTEIKKAVSKKVRQKKHISRFTISYSFEEEDVARGLQDVLAKLNNKNQGRELDLKDIINWAVGKINDKEIKKIQDDSLTIKDKVDLKLQEFNMKNDTNLDIYDFLAKQLKVQ